MHRFKKKKKKDPQLIVEQVDAIPDSISKKDTTVSDKPKLSKNKRPVPPINSENPTFNLDAKWSGAEVFFTVTNFIEEPVTIRIFSIKVEGFCNAYPSLNTVIDVNEKIPLKDLELDNGPIAASIKPKYKDFEIPQGMSKSFHFKIITKARGACHVNLIIGYTNPQTGLKGILSRPVL